MGDVGRYHFLGFIVCRDSYESKWEVIRKGEQVDISYRWFRSTEEAESFCLALYRSAESDGAWYPDREVKRHCGRFSASFLQPEALDRPD